MPEDKNSRGVSFLTVFIVTILIIPLVPLELAAQEDLQACSALLVEHQSPEYSGRYTLTTRLINNSAVYRAENYTEAEESKFRHFYIYKHSVGFTDSGFVWVIQPVVPDSEQWLAFDYADGQTPWLANWDGTTQVECENTRKRSADDNNTIDLMILYTHAAEQEAKLGETDIRELALRRWRALNSAFFHSNMDQRIRLIHIGLTQYDESARRKSGSKEKPLALVTALATDVASGDNNNRGIDSGNIDAVQKMHQLRELLGADLVSVFVSSKGIPCGIGKNAATPNHGGQFANDAYSIVSVKCNAAPALAMAHEIGHNLGLRHDRLTLEKPNAKGYNYGYIDKKKKFYTIMAYIEKCGTECKIIPHWSSPDVFYRNGACKDEPCITGTERENNRQAILENYSEIADFHPHVPADDLIYTPSVDLGLVDVGSEHRVDLYAYNLDKNSATIKNISISGSHNNSEIVLDDKVKDACRVGETIPAYSSCRLAAMVKPTRSFGYHTLHVKIHEARSDNRFTAIQWKTTQKEEL